MSPTPSMCRVPPLTGVPELFRFSGIRLPPPGVLLAAGAGAVEPLAELGAAPPPEVGAGAAPPEVGAAPPPLVVALDDGELLEPLQADSTSDAATAITAPEDSRLFIR